MPTEALTPVITRRQLGRLATDAALELNSYVKGVVPEFNSVSMLSVQLCSKIDTGTSVPVALVSSDLGVMAALSRALEVAEHKIAKDANELTDMTDGIAEKLKHVTSKTEVTMATQLRDFCLLLSSRLCEASFEHLERRPINQWRRSV